MTTDKGNFISNAEARRATLGRESAMMAAFQRGMRDRREGVAYEANPYDKPNLQEIWWKGWETEQRHIDRNPSNPAG